MKALRMAVYQANMEIVEKGLVLYTFGNVSGIDRKQGIVMIKPSGIPYGDLSPENMVPVYLETGKVVEGDLRPSSDTGTHLEVYKTFPDCGGVVHTHSEYATAFAQARQPVECWGTTQADFFKGDVPVTRELTKKEVTSEYEKNTGLIIGETFKKKKIDPTLVQAVLVAFHGPFVWGEDPVDAAQNAVILEYMAKLNFRALHLAQGKCPPKPYLIQKHYGRKHGQGSYYGQK
jgi:L-ribulose-5-phosphate 4-epimerase